MGLFERIFQPRKNKEFTKAAREARGLFEMLTGYRPSFTDWNGEIYESELVRAAIDAKARHIAKLKVEIQGAAQKGLQARLHKEPNPWMTWSQFLYRVSTVLDIHNSAVVVPVLDDSLNTIGFFPVLSALCEVVDYNGEPWLKFRFSRGGTGAVELRRCAVLTRFQYRSDFFGESNSALGDTMRLIHIQNQGIQEAVKTSATYRFMAQVGNFTRAEDLKRERERFTRENLSRDAAGGGLLLFPSTYSNIQQIKTAPYTVDAEQMKLIQDNVYNYFGVNEKVLQNSAAAEDLDAFFNGAIEPFAIQFSEAMTRAAFTDRERSQGACVIANANRLQYMTTTAKVAMAKQLGDRGALLIDEIRELFNYPPLPDGAGQKAPIRGEYHFATDEDEKQEDETGMTV